MELHKVTAANLYEYLSMINLDKLDPEAIRGQQGAAGIKEIYDTIYSEIFEEE